MTYSKLKIGALALVFAISSSAGIRAQSPQPQQPGLPARVVEDPAVKEGWHRYEIGATPTLSLILPSKPNGTVDDVQGQVVNTYVAVNSSGVYAAVRIDRLAINLERATEEARSNYFRTFFQGFAQGFEKAVSKSVKDKLELLEVTQVPTATGRNGFQQRMTLDSLADAVGLHPVHVQRRFKSAMGFTPHEMLVGHRIEYARDLIAGGARVTYAAHAAGFTDQSHLHKTFLGTYAVLPGDYRRLSALDALQPASARNGIVG